MGYKFLGNMISLSDKMIKVGDVMPESNNLRTNDLKAFDFPKTGKYILSFVPSIDTEVCDLQTKGLVETGANLYTVSMDLPFAQAKWCLNNKQNAVTLSDHVDRAFTKALGLFINELGLAYRAVIVVNDNVIQKVFIKDDAVDQVDFAGIKDFYESI